MFGFVVLGFVSSVPSQEIGWEERLRNDRFCVDWGVKLSLSQFASVCAIKTDTYYFGVRTYTGRKDSL